MFVTKSIQIIKSVPVLAGVRVLVAVMLYIPLAMMTLGLQLSFLTLFAEARSLSRSSHGHRADSTSCHCKAKTLELPTQAPTAIPKPPHPSSDQHAGMKSKRGATAAAAAVLFYSCALATKIAEKV